MLSLGTFRININQMTSLSHFGKEENISTVPFSPFVIVRQNILKKFSYDWD